MNGKTKSEVLAMATMLAVITNGNSRNHDVSLSSSKWNANGTNYTAVTTLFTNNTLLAIAKTNSEITIGILFNSRPTAGIYNVVNNNIGSGQCIIQATGTGNNVSLSQGGGKLTVTITDGKIYATFSAVPMVDIITQSAGTISGDLIEQYLLENYFLINKS